MYIAISVVNSVLRYPINFAHFAALSHSTLFPFPSISTAIIAQCSIYMIYSVACRYPRAIHIPISNLLVWIVRFENNRYCSHLYEITLQTSRLSFHLMRVVTMMQKTLMHQSRMLTRVLIQRRENYFLFGFSSCLATRLWKSNALVSLIGRYLEPFYSIYAISTVLVSFRLVTKAFTTLKLQALAGCNVYLLVLQLSKCMKHWKLLLRPVVHEHRVPRFHRRNTISVIYGSKLFAPLHPFSAFVVTESTRYFRSCAIVPPNSHNVLMELGARDI